MKDCTDYIIEESTPFEEKAFRVFEHQYRYNSLYRRFCDELGRTADTIETPRDIPLLPVEAFREAHVLADYVEMPDLIFLSSGTSAMARSRHPVAAEELYRASVLRGMACFYDDLDRLAVWGYTPGYDQNPASSLLWMIRQLIDYNTSGYSRFLPLGRPLDEALIDQLNEDGYTLMLFGAAFGLLDLVEQRTYRLPESSIIMETGGMKTHRREITREELHQRLARGFGLPRSRIHSEYGMTEMLSQAYARGETWFETPPWLQISIRDPENPLRPLPEGQEGLIGVLDLANIHSCSFLLTGDRGVQQSSRRFQALGRWNRENLRGCNFLLEEER